MIFVFVIIIAPRPSSNFPFQIPILKHITKKEDIMKLSKDAVQLYKTLTRAQQEVWAISVKAGFKPVIIPDTKNKKKKVLSRITCKHKCGKTAIVFKKGKTVFAVCSSKHATRLES
jgi:hypothetical protein